MIEAPKQGLQAFYRASNTINERETDCTIFGMPERGGLLAAQSRPEHTRKKKLGASRRAKPCMPHRKRESHLLALLLSENPFLG